MADRDEVLQKNMTMLADKAVQTAVQNGIRLDFSQTSLSLLENAMSADWRSRLADSARTQNEIDSFVRIWGAYLGETFRRDKNGVWQFNRTLSADRQVHIGYAEQAAYPLEQIRRWVSLQPAAVVKPPTPVVSQVIPKPASTPEYAPIFPAKKPKSRFYPQGTLQWTGALVAGILLLTLVIWGLTAAAGAIKNFSREQYAARFAELMPQYMLPYQSGAAYSEPAEAGKILVVDTSLKQVADWHYDLPSEVKASSTADLGLLVQQECHAEEMGFYEGTTIVNRREVCRLAIIDLRNGHQIAERTFYGEELLQEIHVDENGLPIEKDLGGAIDHQVLIDWTVANYGQ